MDREQAKHYIRAEIESYLIAKGINTNGNFKCLMQEHQHDDSRPGMSYNRSTRKAHCFKCNSDFDIFDLMGRETGRTGVDLFNYAYASYGLNVDGIGSVISGVTPQPLPHREPIAEVPLKGYDFTNAVEKAHADDRGRAHYKSRGLTDEIINKYRLGYADNYNNLLTDQPELQTTSAKQNFYNYIFPYLNNDDSCSYFLAEISDREQIDRYSNKYRKMKANIEIDGTAYRHPAHIFNERYLKGNTPNVLYICEGVYDALSYEVAGACAIAFIGTAHKRFLSLCREHKPKTHFIITLDNDSSGEQAKDKVAAGLTELGIPFTIANPAGAYKDANDALQADSEAFKGAAMEAVNTINAEAAAEQDTEKQAYMNNSAANHIQDFINGIDSSVNTDAIKTGFVKFDGVLDGGLYEELYVIGAISSLGKTTFIMQAADQIAQTGQDVLIFSLEMARTELMAKSISRETLLYTMQGGSTSHAKTAREITTGKRWATYSQTEKDIIKDSIKAYSLYANNLYISEGMGDIGAKQIRDTVEKHIRVTGKKPVVIIDYLQLLAPHDPRSTDKQNTDKSVLELKRLSRDYKIPVIAISSFNRMSYNSPVTMEAFKESGAIEYSSDVLMGLQLKGVVNEKGETNKNFDVNVAKAKDPREIELVILKNRNGETGGKLAFEYYPRFNYFREV